MSKELSMPTKYYPKEVEAKWYDFWMEKEVFKADEKSEKESSIYI